MGLVMLVVVVLIVADSLLSDFEQSTLLSEPKVDEETGVVVVWKVKNCVAGEQLSIYHVVLLICEGLGVFCLAVLAHYTRKVPSAFAESKYIAIAIYNILILAAIFVLLLVSLKMNNNFPNLMVGMSGFCIFFGLGGLQLLLFIPKFLLVIKGKDIDLSDITPKKEKEKERGGGGGMRKFSSNGGGGSSTNLGAVTSPMKNMAKRKSAPNVLYKHATSSSGGSSFKSSMGNISEEGDEEDGVGGAGVKVEVEVDDIGMGWKDEKTLQNELRFAKGVEKELRQELDEKAKELAKMKKLTKRLSITSGKSLARGMIGKVAGAGAGAGGGGGRVQTEYLHLEAIGTNCRMTTGSFITTIKRRMRARTRCRQIGLSNVRRFKLLLWCLCFDKNSLALQRKRAGVGAEVEVEVEVEVEG